MGHSYINVFVHIVFSTKERRKIIPTDKQEELWKYMTGIARKLGVNTIAIGGMPDHIHMLVAESGVLPISSLLQKVKGSSSKWLGAQLRGFAWQEGFGAFGVSASHRDKVIAYIQNQPEHHKKRSFEEEFLTLLKAVGVDYDPRYVLG